MEYSLRRYVAIQRLIWFVFFLACLAIAYPLTSLYRGDYENTVAVASIQPDVLKSAGFWMQSYWLAVDPLGKVILYVFWVALVFLIGKFAWLLLQYVGRGIVKGILKQTVKNPPGRPKPVVESVSASRQKLFPAEPILRKVDAVPLRFLLHPFQRLRLMLVNPQEVLSSEELTEKERRVVEMDSHIFWTSWGPFRWLLWVLPLLALMQTCWLLYLQLAPAVTAQKSFEDLLGPFVVSLLPLVQIVVVAIVFNLASGLLKRLEDLYLSNVDALLYDQLVSRVPFQSSDTPVILEALQKHFKELHAVLRRLESTANHETDKNGSCK